jgi:serine-type D-Ala-D-Ala carboxypeptidase/endopeptidase (penicillin-binding protein 4)
MKNNKASQFIKFSLLNRQIIFAVLAVSWMLNACSVSRQINKAAEKNLLNDAAVASGHTGICIYEPATGKYWYNYNAEKYFVPASNTKLFTLYAGMKYLGDSLKGMRYTQNDSAIFLIPTGDPTFLHPDFKPQPVLSFLQNEKRKIFININNWKDNSYGKGWSWDDYNEPFMAERSLFPVAGNIATFENHKTTLSANLDITVYPKYFESKESRLWLLINALQRGDIVKASSDTNAFLSIVRKKCVNEFDLSGSKVALKSQQVPFITDSVNSVLEILKNDHGIEIFQNKNISSIQHPTFIIIKTQPSDALFKPMMYNSDNFFAEQTLLMVSNERLGFMSDEAIIDTLLKTDLSDIPQKPKWVDGSGLSRYNLFTPGSFIYILSKMKDEFGLERLKNILPTGGQGTLKNYFMADSGHIFAKTGSMSNQVSISGFLETKKGKLLIFSVLNNNFQGKASTVRRRVEYFLEQVRSKY